MIKFVEAQICHLYGNPIRILIDIDPNFDSAAVRDYASASIDWKLISAYNPRGSAKIERMVGTLKRAIQKVVVSNNDRNWEDCLGEILGGYRRRPGLDLKSPFEILFGIRPRFAVEPPQLDLDAFITDLAREYKVAIAKSAIVSLIVPRVLEK